MKTCGIDPGPEESALVLWDTEVGIVENIILSSSKVNEVIEIMTYDVLAIEDIILYGFAPAGQTTAETLRWIGEFRCWGRVIGKPVHFITRPQITSHFCRTPKARKSNVNLMLMERFGSKRTKKEPGYNYGMKSHMWDAFAIAVTCWDMFYEKEEK